MTASVTTMPSGTNDCPVGDKPDSKINLSNLSLYRLPQVLARIPVSRSSWYSGINTGRYPRGRSLGPRTTVWRSDEIDQLIDSINNRAGEA